MTATGHNKAWIGNFARPTSRAPASLQQHDRLLVTAAKFGLLKNAPPVEITVRLPDGQDYTGTPDQFQVEGERALCEDVASISIEAQLVRTLLDHWAVQRNYHRPDWSGLEWMHFRLAQLNVPIAPELVGECIYPSSEHADFDNKDWRLVIDRVEPPVTVNCRSFAHNDSWTLSTAVIDLSDGVNRAMLNWCYDPDPWLRSMLLTAELLRAMPLSAQRESTVAIADIYDRIEWVRSLRPMIDKTRASVEITHQQLFGRPSEMPQYVSVGTNDWYLPPERIAAFIAPCKEWGFDGWAVIIVARRAMERPDYVAEIVLHELIHAALNDACSRDGGDGGHTDAFMALADATGLPQNRRF